LVQSLEIITGKERRRRWTDEEKRRLIGTKNIYRRASEIS